MNTSLYIHIPFCTHRCAYCDFNTYAGQEDSIPAYVEALRREIEHVGAASPEDMLMHTVFFGGGTPSLLSAEQFRAILQAIRTCFRLDGKAEITIEANPGTVIRSGLAELRQAGINRISFGAQSANGEELRMLERAHSFLDVMEAVSNARAAGFDNLNLDLIYGLPEQQLATWQTTVRRVLDLHPEHISAYALTLEHGTPFGRWSRRGLLAAPDPDDAAEMYGWAGEAFEAAGYQQYEISNWARELSAEWSARAHGVADGGATPPRPISAPAFACRHNLQYWRGLPYLGLGAGAHGYANGQRYSNVLRIKTYIERLSEPEEARQRAFPLSPAAVNQHWQSAHDDMSEFMITGLRLTRGGVDARTFHERFGKDLDAVYGAEIEDLKEKGLLESIRSENAASEAAEVIRLTKRGRLLGNQVFLRFV